MILVREGSVARALVENPNNQASKDDLFSVNFQVPENISGNSIFDQLVNIDQSQKRVKTFSTRIPKYLHFAVDSNQLIVPKDIHRIVYTFLGIGTYSVKRIIKSHSQYIRLSILRSVPETIIKDAILRLRILLEAKVKRLKLTANKDLKSKPRDRNVENTTILTFNINHIQNKIEELNLKLNFFRPTIICLQETGMTDGSKNIHINGYRTIESKAKDGGLGLLIGIRKDVNLIPKVLDSNENIIVFSVTNQDTKLIIANVYQNNKDPMRSKTREDVISILNKYDSYPTIIVGDWNQKPQDLINQLEKAKLEVYASNCPTRGTRVKSNMRRSVNVIDYGISNQSDLIISQCARRHWNMSDHLPIMLTINNKHKTSACLRKVIFDRNLLNSKKVIKAIQNICIDNNHTAEDAVNQLSLTINEKLRQLKVIREVKIISRLDFLSSRIIRLIKTKNDTAKLVHSNILSIDEYKKAKSLVKREIKKFRRRRFLNYINKGIKYLKVNNSKNAWKWIKNHAKLNNKSKIPNQVLDKSTGELVDDPITKLQIWSNHFKDLCQDNTEYNSINTTNSNLYKDVTDGNITWDEIKVELKSTRNGKAAGDDNIPSELYKISLINEESDFSKTLLSILNKVFNEGICPTQWENCTVVPVFKKGNVHDTNNYRGIALINTLQKILAKIIAKRLQLVCNQYNLLHIEQAGFMLSGECPSQIATLLECCQRRKFKNENTVLCFLDLKKAYDMVPHQKLIDKLVKKQLGSKLIDFIKSMYSNTKMRVKIGDSKSNTFEYKRGVRQGCPTSPLLFNIYIDDLIESIEPIKVQGLPNGFRGLMFADDTVIAANDFNDLKDKLTLVQQWMQSNDMEINPSKCGIMLIKANDDIQIQDIHYNNELIPIVDSYVYLGVDFNNSLDLQVMANYRVQKGIIKSQALTPTLRNYLVPLEYKKMLVNNIIIPTVTYGTEIFGMSERRTQRIKRVVDLSLSQILKTKNFCRNRTYEEFDIKSVHVKAAISRTRAITKWKNSNFLIKYLIDSTNKYKSRNSTWTKGTNIWLKRFKIDLNNPNRSSKQLVLDNYSSRIEKRDKTLATKLAKDYKIKSSKFIRKLEIQQSLKPLGVYQLMKLRTGTFNFTNNLVYKGFIRSEYKNKCICCNESTVEDIKHLLLYCNAFTQERNNYLKAMIPSNLGNINIKLVIKKILGGDCPASGKMPAENIVKTIDYLSAISLRRSQIILNLQKRNM